MSTDEPDWEEVARRIDAFSEAWSATDAPPALAAHAPPPGDPSRLTVLVELIKIDQEERWGGAGAPVEVERYLEEFVEVAGDDASVAELVAEEIHVRRRAGEAVDAEEYRVRFPAVADRLPASLGWGGDEAAPPGSDVPAVESGERIDDFVIDRELGRGAFASVHLARQVSLPRIVALKLSRDDGPEPAALARFNHPGIVRVHDRKTLADRGLRLLYMEYVPGGTLHDVIAAVRAVPRAQRSGRLVLDTIDRALEVGERTTTIRWDVREQLSRLSWSAVVARIGARLARSLGYAHGKGVLHRDVKPANVLFTPDGEPKLADFNVSASGTPEATLAGEGSVGGSLAYMAPEQLAACAAGGEGAAGEVAEPADFWSLGVVLFELLEGARPFDDDAPGPDLRAHANRMAEARRSIGAAAVDALTPESSAEARLLRIIARCLDPDPARRPVDGAALGRELEVCLDEPACGVLEGPRKGWRRVCLRAPLASALTVALVPNALAGVFNYAYNRREIVDSIEGTAAVFDIVQLAINAVAFPLGVALLIALSRRPMAALRRVSRPGATPTLESVRRARREICRFGRLAVWVGVSEWAIAGVAYPLALHLALGGVEPAVFVHFAASLILCGLIAASYPYFGIAALTVEVFWPALLRPTSADPGDEECLAAVTREMRGFILLSSLVPMLGVLLLLATGSENRVALEVLCGLAALGFAALFALWRRLGDEIEALRRVIRCLTSG